MLQDRVEIGGIEGALAWLVDHRFPRLRIEVLHDVVTGLASNQDPAHGTAIADARLQAAARFFRRRTVGEIGPVPFASVHDQEPALARSPQHAAGRRHRAAQPGHVVSERLPEAAGVDEIALEVDQEERGRPRLERERVRFRLHLRHGHLSLGSRGVRDGDGATAVTTLLRLHAEAKARSNLALPWLPLPRDLR